MDIKQISQNDLNEIIATTGFDYDLSVKDYYITILLYLLKDIKGIYFKGGTALQLTILDHARLSEDIDFTVERPLNKVKQEIKDVIKTSSIFGNITQDKDVNGFIRLIVPYKSHFGKDKVFIDLNERGKLLTKPEILEMKHIYPNIPKFSVPCLSIKEMVSEKVAAAIGRNKPRDHYDIYQIIKHNIPIDMSLVTRKCKQSGDDPSILKMFNKAKKLHKKWDQDMLPLITEEVHFKDVMKTIAKYFNLKEEKEKTKQLKQRS